MVKYILKRLFQSLLTVLLVVCIVFFLMRLMPTDYFPVYKEEMEKVFGANTCFEIKLA